MKRWRRPLLVIALLLLAGAVVNIVVAWILVGAPDSWLGSQSQSQFYPAMEKLPRAERPEPARPPLLTIQWDGRPRRPPHAAWRGTGWTCFRSLSDVDLLRWVAHRVDCGWPFRSLTFTSIRTEDWPQDRNSLSFPAPRRLAPDRWFSDPRDRLPLSPIVLGFLLNTLFYTALLALPLTFFPIRRHLRTRRGRCPKCGYTLAGLAARVCPECGVPVAETEVPDPCKHGRAGASQ